MVAGWVTVVTLRKRRNPMPTIRKRLMITPTDEVLLLINEMARLMEIPKSAVVLLILDQVKPGMQTTIEALRIVKEQPREAQRLMSNFSARATMELAQQQLELDAAIDARTVKGKLAKRRAGARSP